MCHNSLKLKQVKKHVQGSALVIAIFVLVIMSLIGAALVRMQGSSAEAMVYEVIGTRTYAAAQTGIQWQLTEVFPLDTSTPTACSPIPEPDISSTAGLEGCFFVVTCDSFSSEDPDNSTLYYTIESTGTCSIADIKTSRTIKVKAKSIE
ncbi:MAG: pilus assembly PilX N-terminal domain-containing protein [Colwellia sp.]|nr:pilus assembly PilX N-terminal domain-containing protein [Colwellia sp.]